MIKPRTVLLLDVIKRLAQNVVGHLFRAEFFHELGRDFIGQRLDGRLAFELFVR